MSFIRASVRHPAAYHYVTGLWSSLVTTSRINALCLFGPIKFDQAGENKTVSALKGAPMPAANVLLTGLRVDNKLQRRGAFKAAALGVKLDVDGSSRSGRRSRQDLPPGGRLRSHGPVPGVGSSEPPIVPPTSAAGTTRDPDDTPGLIQQARALIDETPANDRDRLMLENYVKYLNAVERGDISQEGDQFLNYAQARSDLRTLLQTWHDVKHAQEAYSHLPDEQRRGRESPREANWQALTTRASWAGFMTGA